VHWVLVNFKDHVLMHRVGVRLAVDGFHHNGVVLLPVVAGAYLHALRQGNNLPAALAVMIVGNKLYGKGARCIVHSGKCLAQSNYAGHDTMIEPRPKRGKDSPGRELFCFFFLKKEARAALATPAICRFLAHFSPF
jgi:hypothetical protein